MRLLRLLVPCLLAAPLQEDADLKRIRGLLAELDDDRIEARETATEQLLGLDPQKLPLLRDSLPRLAGEARERLLGIIQKLDLRQKLGMLLPRPSLISLPDRDLSVREALDLIRKQTRTPIGVEEDLKGLDVRLRLPLASVPLWEALERLCTLHGRLSPTLSGGRVALLDRGRTVKTSLHRGSLSVWLEQLSVQTSRLLGNPDPGESCQLQVGAAWESGGSPTQVRAVVLAAADDTGRVIVEDGDEIVPAYPQASGAAPNGCFLELPLPEAPSGEASRLTRLRIRVEFHYPIERHEIRIELPFPRSAPRQGGTAGVAATLESLGTDEGFWHGVLNLKHRIAGSPELILESARLLDKEGKAWEGIFPLNLNHEGTGVLEIPVTFAAMPPKADPRRLDLKVVTRTHVETLDLDLRDLPLAGP